MPLDKTKRLVYDKVNMITYRASEDQIEYASYLQSLTNKKLLEEYSETKGELLRLWGIKDYDNYFDLNLNEFQDIIKECNKRKI